jgi:protein-tyrosine phosphatase
VPDTTNEPPRLRLAGAHNFRDLGGLPTADGRRTRAGLLFRSDALFALTDDDVEALRGLGISTVVDLRAPSEIDRDGHGPFVAPPVRYVNHILFGDPAFLTSDDLERWDSDVGGGYLDGLEATREAAIAVLDLMVQPDSLPLVFHCNAGKDRTGVVAAIVLGCVGVTREAIVTDYLVTDEAMERILARIREDPSAPPVPEGPLPPRLTARRDTIERFLALLDDRFGGPRGWARDAGVSDATLEELERVLLG